MTTADEPAQTSRRALAPGPGIRLAGTFYHQDTLRRAFAVAEPGADPVRRIAVRLRHDAGSAAVGAVAVEHDGRLVGHLPRAWAPLFHDVLTASEQEGQVVTATAALRCGADDTYVSAELEARPPGAEADDPAGTPQSGSAARAAGRRARSRGRWPFGTVLVCVVASAAAVVGPAAAAEVATLVTGTHATRGSGGGSVNQTAL